MIRYFLYFSIFQLIRPQANSECDLLWKTKQGLGYGNGLKLQLCCNVSKVSIWSFSNISSFAIGEKVFETDIDTPTEYSFLSQLQLSKCSDSSKPTLGYVANRPGLNCTYKYGHAVDIPNEKVKFPGWYVVCYEFNNGCDQLCSIEVLCENDMSSTCGDIYLMSSSPSSTNTSLAYWVQVGRTFPFDSSTATVEVKARNDRNIVAFEKRIQPKAFKTENILINGLQPNEMYRIERCLVIPIPEILSLEFNFPSNTSRLCDEEGFITQRTSAASYVLTLLLVFFNVILFILE